VSLPDPLATVGAVALDLEARTATVIPAETGYPAMLWQQGYRAMVKAERTSRYGAPDVWADAPGRRQVARGQPEGGALKFTFRKGDPAWAELVGTAGLSAFVTVDRRTNRILGVTFRGRNRRAV
jgi:hypothetical protein